MKRLLITWQRLLSPKGETCPRCGSTQQEVEGAIAKLEIALAPLDIEPVLETRALDEETFKHRPSESNRIWISGKPIEEWLGAGVGSTKCCSVCGDSLCRTVVVDNASFEVVPEELIVKAALLAATELVGPKVERQGACGGACDCRPAQPGKS